MTNLSAKKSTWPLWLDPLGKQIPLHVHMCISPRPRREARHYQSSGMKNLSKNKVNNSNINGKNDLPLKLSNNNPEQNIIVAKILLTN